MNQSPSARREYGKIGTSVLSSRGEDPDESLYCSVARILCSNKDAFESAQKLCVTRNTNCDQFSEDFRLEFARQLGFLAPARFNCLPDDGPGLEVLEEYLKQISRLEAEWRKCKADAQEWLACKDTQESRRALEHAGDAIAYIAIRDKDPDLAPSTWPEDPCSPDFNPLRPHELKNLNQWGRSFIPDFVSKIVGQHSWADVARIAAFARFAEVVDGRPRIRYCKGCDRAFNASSRQIFCSDKCGHSYSSKCSRRDNTRAQNQLRIMTAVPALNRWIENPRGKWRRVVEAELAHKHLGPVDRRSQWLGRCIVAAKLPDKHPKRQRLAELCTSRKANVREARMNRGELIKFLGLINRADRVENELMSKT